MKNKLYNLVAVEKSGCRWITYYTYDLSTLMRNTQVFDIFANRCQNLSKASNTSNREVVAAWTLDDQRNTKNEFIYFLPIFNQTPIIGFELWIIDRKMTSVSDLRCPFLGR